MVLGGHGYPKWPPLGQKNFFLAQKKFSKFFSESSSQNMMFDTKTNLLSFVDPKLWPFKSWRYPKNAKISKAHNTAPRAPRAKKFCISKFHPRGYLHAKNDQNRWDKGVKLLTSALECPKRKATTPERKNSINLCRACGRVRQIRFWCGFLF